MLFYILLILSNLFVCNTDELLNVDLNKVKEWANQFNKQINLINSYGCANQIQNTYEANAEIVTINPVETLNNTVDGIKLLFTDKNRTLHKLVDAAQYHARIYSQQVFNNNRNQSENATNAENDETIINLKSNLNDVTTNRPEINQLTTKTTLNLENRTINQNLSTFYKAIEYPDDYQNNQTKFISPNEIYNDEYRQITTSRTDEAIENQGESTNKLNENDRFDDEFNSFIVSEEENMQNQLEIDKKINESLNRANYLTTTPKPNLETSSITNDKEKNEVIDKEVTDAINDKKDNQTEIDEIIEEDDDLLYFIDTKKIYSPDKPLSNLSIPRLVPDDDLSELNEIELKKFKEFKERWKTWTPLKTIKHGLFPNYRSNFTASGLHIPLNVYPQQDTIKHAIKWSERLDETFKENRKLDSYLSFQFFCSNDGFLRMFPAIKWRIPELFENSPENEDDEVSDEDLDEYDPSRALDLYDCRLRDWYIKAASAPKDVIILIDSSGSMRGERSIIGQNVLINILDTLTENDYVSIVRFNTKMHPIEECFKMDFVQANRRNVAKFNARILELGHEENLEKSELYGNYTIHIQKAFELLNEEKNSSNCNKVMMLVTDGDLDNLDDLFKSLNKNGTIRVFTYLVGREVVSSPNTESIACKNNGYFIHLKDLAEVKEEVQLYVPVLSRSIGLRILDPRSQLATTFSSIYADQVLLSLNDMIWERYENKLLEKYEFKINPDIVQPELMITMSMPVFNITNGTQTSWDLIGVVGLDVPLREILNEIPFYRLGVNSHVFITNNNGFLIYHPDLRPLYKGFLKNFYTSLDLLEVELVDDGKEARDENKKLLEIRKSMIDDNPGCEELDSKFHYDSMTRVSTRKHNICWRRIPNTLFSIAISIPSIYGSFKVNAPFKIKPNVDYSNYFDLEGSEWSVHPKWTYCWDNLYNSEVNREDRTEKLLLEMTPKEQIEHFLHANLLDSSSFTLQAYLFNEEREHLNSKFFCNQELLSSLIFDANATRISLGSCSSVKLNEKLKLKPINAFLSTRSGLTRYFEFDSNKSASSDEFKRFKSIDENIYKKAVDYSIKYESNYFIFQLEKSSSQTFITASRALILKNGTYRRKKNWSKKRENEFIRTPYAVLGVQFDYESFLESIEKPNFTNKSTRTYFLDDNGYMLFGFDDQNELIKDNSTEASGLLLSEYDSELFDDLINQSVYRRIKIFDYQAICEHKKETKAESSSSIAVQPTLINFILKSVITVINEFGLFISFWLSSLATLKPVNALEEDDDEDPVAPLPDRTQTESCRKDFIFYELNKSFSSKEPKLNSFKRQNGEPDNYIIYKLPKTNLIMVITSDEYPTIKKSYIPNVSYEKAKCDRDTFHRRRPYMSEETVCHPNEEEKNIQSCGATSSGFKLKDNFFLYLFFLSLKIIFF